MQRIFQHCKAPFHFKSRYFFARADEFKPKVCFYKVLNVSSDAKFEEIKSSYLKLAKKYHPDANPDLIQSEKFKDISEAYNVLSNQEKREQYDSRNGMGSKWKYEEERAQYTYGSKEQESPKEDPIEKQKNDEQAFEYFDKKYFKNTEYFKKNVIDDNEFELTMKLYKTHKEEVTEKKKDYVEFFPQTSSQYFVHKKVEAQAIEENSAGNLLYEFRIPALVLVLAIIGLGINQGVSQKENSRVKVQQSK